MINMRELLTGKTRLVAHVSRFAGTPAHRRENVAEHSYMTAMIALFLGQHCLERGARVDIGKLLTRALVHDLDEAVMVDLPRPIKYADPVLKERWTSLCNEAVIQMGEAVGISFFTDWKNAKDDSLEGEILRLADLISVTAYLIEEARFGNTFMKSLLTGNLEYLTEFYRTARSSEIRELVLQAVTVMGPFLDEGSPFLLTDYVRRDAPRLGAHG